MVDIMGLHFNSVDIYIYIILYALTLTNLHFLNWSCNFQKLVDVHLEGLISSAQKNLKSIVNH